MQQVFDAILDGLLREIVPGQPESDPGGMTVLLAVSGGIDSMCMADLFLHSSTGVRFAVAHCNFSLRGEESDGDEALVTEWADSAGIRLHKTRFNTLEYASGHGISVEMAARDLRYSWFSRLCKEYGYRALAVAHNANDNVETLFLNLLRGTGLKGLSGMRQTGTLPLPDPDTDGGCENGSPVLVRPLLGFTRKQIEGHVFAHKVKYRDDRTNFDTEYKRNKLRNLVFPVFERINPSFIRTLSREMGHFAQAERIADDYYAGNRSEWMHGRRIDLDVLRRDRNWEYLLYRALDEYGFAPSVTASLTDLLKSGRTVSGKVFSSGRYMVVTSGRELVVEEAVADGLETPADRLRFRRSGTLPRSVTDRFSDTGETMVVNGPGDYFFNGVSFSVRTVARNVLDTLAAPSGVLYFDSRALPFPFICRKWMKGDWMIPFGMKGRKKVSDIFTDLKYNLIDKSESVMLIDCRISGVETGDASGHRVAAVLGVRIDDAKKVCRDTETVLVVKVNESE